jgi:polyhydroxyalkanoate synthesis regulator phasin
VSDGPREGGVTEALRTAVERTLAATTGSAAASRERAGELLDEVARRGREARDELASRGRGARDQLSNRGQEARGELVRRLESLERRLASLEEALRAQTKGKPED